MVKIIIKRPSFEGELASYIEDFWDFIPTPIILINPLNIILSISKSFEQVSGYTSGEIVGENLNKIFKDQRLVNKLAKEVAEKEEILNLETLFLNKEDKEIPVTISAKKRRDKEGGFIGYFLTITEITEIKALQESLEKKVEERTKELQKRVAELEKFHELTVGRELKMIELKKKIKELEKGRENNKIN